MYMILPCIYSTNNGDGKRLSNWKETVTLKASESEMQALIKIRKLLQLENQNSDF